MQSLHCRAKTVTSAPLTRWRYPQTRIEGRVAQLLRPSSKCGTRPPLVCDLGRRLVSRSLPAGILDALNFGRVLQDIAAGTLEISERVVARRVPSRAPAQNHTFLHEPTDSTHHLIQITHLERRMVETHRPRDEREAVMKGIAAQKAHEVAQPVADPQAQIRLIEGDRLLEIGSVENHVRQRRWNRLAVCELPCGPIANAARQLHRAAIDVEEAEAVPSTRLIEAMGLGDQPHPRRLQSLGPAINRRMIRNGERENVESLFRSLTQAKDKRLAGPLGGKIRCVGVLRHLRQTPDAAGKRPLGGKIRYSETNISQVSHSIVGHDFPLSHIFEVGSVTDGAENEKCNLPISRIQGTDDDLPIVRA